MAKKLTTVGEQLQSLIDAQEKIPADVDGVAYWDNPAWKFLDVQINRLRIGLAMNVWTDSTPVTETEA
jgi:hypothetical protein